MFMRVKAALIIMAIIFAFTVASFFLSMSFTHRHMTEMMEQELSLALDIADTVVSTRIRLLYSNTETMAARIGAASTEDRMDVMTTQLEEFKDFISLTIYDQQGIVDHYGDPVNHDVFLLEREDIEAAFNGESFLSSAHYNNENGTFVIHVFVPVGSGKALSATLSGLFFSEILSEYQLWQTGSIFVVDSQGTFVASHRNELVLEQRNFIKEAKTDSTYESAAKFYKTVIENNHGSGRYFLEQKERLCVYKHVTGSQSGWYIGVVAPLSESPLRTVQNGLLLAALLFLIVGVVVSIFVSGIVIKPFITIQKQAAQIQADHERASLLLDTMPLACRLWNRDFKIFDCNEEAVKFFCMKDKQEYMARFPELSPEFQPDGQRSRDVILKNLERVFSEESKIVFEWMSQLPDGTPIPTEITLTRVQIGGEYCVASYARDLREYKQMMADIDYQKSLLRVGNRTAQMLLMMEDKDSIRNLLLDSMELVGRAVDADRVQIWQNEMRDGNLHFVHIHEWCSDFGHQRIDIPIGLSFPYDDIPHWKEMFLRGECINGPLSELPEDDQKFLNMYEIKSIANLPLFVQDHFWGFFSIDNCRQSHTFSEDEIDIMQSVSLMMANAINLHEASVELEAALRDAEKANNAKSSFLAKMSHEMRTPLNAIIGLTDLALENIKPDDGNLERLVKINNAGLTLLGTVNDVLDISKIESGNFELVCTVYDVPSLINDAVTQSTMHRGEKPIEFTLHIDENLPAQLYGDELRVRQILNNILTNAFKYTRQGKVELDISCVTEGGTVYFTANVRDTGIGIQPEHIDDIFVDYTQVDTVTNHNIIGTGLGLAITKKMVELMDGHIQVESEYGKGSTFSVKFPQKIVNDVVIGKEMVENLKNFRYFDHKRMQNAKFSRIDLPYARVLIVDDVASNLDVAKGLMKPYGMKIDCVENGQLAIDAIRDEKVRYNAVFMDHMMPDLDGVESARLIREIGTDYAKAIPIIALTANAVTGNEEMFLSKGFQAFIPKPIDLTRLDSVLRLWVRDKEQEKQYLDRQVDVVADTASDVRSGQERRVAFNRRSGIDRRKFGKLYDEINVEKGLKRFNSDKDVYLGVLRSFAANTRPLLEKILEVNEENLPGYTITVHGIKGSSRGIFAEEVGAKAEALEKAGKSGDFEFVRGNNPEFIELVQTLIDDIETALKNINLKNPKPKKDKPDEEVLKNLFAACKKYDMDGVDVAMAEIERYDYNVDGEIVGWLRVNVDETNFAKIVEELSYLEE